MKNWNTAAQDRKFILSYSGGKDSTLALYQASLQGQAMGLIVMLNEGGEVSGAHGLSRAFFQAQADAMGVPVRFGVASWADYERVFTALLVDAKHAGAQVLVTGDIDVPEHECWHERVTGNAGLGLAMPLWRQPHDEVVDAFIDLGFVTMVVGVQPQRGMTRQDLGRILTPDYVAALRRRGIDPCGEGGEFHTAVMDGPLFQRKLTTQKMGFVSDAHAVHLRIEPV